MASRLRVSPTAQSPASQMQGAFFRTKHEPHNRAFSLSFRSQASKKRSSSQLPPNQSTPPLRSRASPSNSSKRPDAPDVVFQQRIERHRKWALIGGGIFLFGATTYVSMMLTSLLKAPPPPSEADAAALAAAAALGPLCSIGGTPTGRPREIDEAVARGSSDEELRMTAEAFDKDLNVPEQFAVQRQRKNLASQVRGHVLEVAVGTGRNLQYYDWTAMAASKREEREKLERERVSKLTKDHVLDGRKLTGAAKQTPHVLSFTGVDISPHMMEIARGRLRDSVPGLNRILRKRRLEPLPKQGTDDGAAILDTLDGRVRLIMVDAQKSLPLPAVSSELAPQRYDTVVQSFGLCSVADPARLLANMAAVVKPDTGRIILLEHGRGYFEWINHKLDQFALPHFKKYGCWWNRDIERIVQDAAETVPGLEVVSLKRPGITQLGTTLVIELRVKSQPQVSGLSK
ncbi:S-adenosyl-L-methionine-dependent methyltransferase [Podospora didyma]|uniref:S-adenosyl-L-methionine-dependent methyltransferase n=1 Tax=Podospora didyma TaxID=330526 RepID=A0AAE0NHI6_9PEZI|nr:S-adenosyl-L-methionine-dependent methyltransferase [Podospora didyma]